jgi:hypothetical protein
VQVEAKIRTSQFRNCEMKFFAGIAFRWREKQPKVMVLSWQGDIEGRNFLRFAIGHRILPFPVTSNPKCRRLCCSPLRAS